LVLAERSIKSCRKRCQFNEEGFGSVHVFESRYISVVAAVTLTKK
jgi:hypothetical protein